MKNQIITFSWQFPDYHPRRGKQTHFAAKLHAGLGYEMNRHRFDSEATATAIEII